MYIGGACQPHGRFFSLFLFVSLCLSWVCWKVEVRKVKVQARLGRFVFCFVYFSLCFCVAVFRAFLVFLRACWKVEVWRVKVKVRQVCFCFLFLFLVLFLLCALGFVGRSRVRKVTVKVRQVCLLSVVFVFCFCLFLFLRFCVPGFLFFCGLAED